MVKRLQWPIKFNTVSGGFNTVEQHSSLEILGAAETVIRTVQGERQANPDFGVPDSLFSLGDVNPQPFIDAIEVWEPRASSLVEVSSLEGMITRIRMELSA